MKKFLLDTSIIIDFLRRKEKQETFLYKLSENDLYISIISHTELYAGKSIWQRNEAKEELETVFSGLTILPLEENISQKAGYFKAKYHNTGLFDCIIAATAVEHDLPLVTLNIKDFKNIEGILLYNE